MSVDRWRHPALLLFVLATVQLVGLALFCKGFFPYKVYLPGFSGVDSLPPWPDGTTASPFAEAVFDRLALVVVDALRNDFVLGRDSGFDFVRSLIERGEALPFTARATAPTVTMPRIKAMTTGTIPSFLDAILNIAESDTSSSLLHHDNWVHQFRQRGNRTIHFYGDDTWIRLFPDAFTKMDGTTSFYVSDTVQVDLNVTRHIRSAFSEQNWDAIILHYLGLDHVGHLGGPYSPLMRPKQQEMDQAIELIYEIVAQQDAERIVRDPNAKGTLIVLCGDHGMNEVGNHGGSSVGETSAALVFLSPRFASRPILVRQSTMQFDEDRPIVLGYPIIDQVDLVPTLASLFGFPIPKNNLGKIIPDIFRKLSQDPKPLLRALQVNAYQLGLLLAEIDPTISTYLHDPFSFDSKKQDTNNPAYWYVQAVLLHKNAMKADSHVDQEASAYYTKFINFAQSRLAKTASNYDLRLMVIGTSFIIGSTVFLIAWNKATTQGARGSTVWNFSKTFSVLGISAYCISMFASSFVEEEHTIWYYYVQTLCLLAAIQSMRLCELPIRERYWLVLMQIAQMILFRVSVVVHYYPDMWEKSIWHLVALSLVTPVLLVSARLVRRTGNVGTNNNSEVSSSANYIRLLCKGASILLVCLTSCLVMIYKIRDATTPAPSIYTDALAGLYEFTSQLDQVQLGRLIYNYGGSCIFVAGALAYVDRRASDLQLQEQTNRAGKYLDLILYMSTPILILLTRSHNAVLFVIYCIQFELMRAWNRALSARGKERQLLQLPPWHVATQMLCMIQAAFYATGHSNSIAAVDLSNAYIGVSSYDPMTIGLLTFLSNWSAPLWWGTAGWVLVADMADAASWWNYLVPLSAVFGSALSALSVSVTVLREHLFIWTVFSPKYLYQMAWTTLFHWFSQALLGTIFIKLLAA